MGGSAAIPAVAGLDLPRLVEQCLATERELGLAEKSLRECGRYLREFAQHCVREGVRSITDITTSFLTDYIETRSRAGGPALTKHLVWSIRKLFGYLTVRQLLRANPARDLRHPPISPRAHLPEYLNATQLRELLTRTAQDRPLQDVAILLLIATTGMRPFEVAGLKRRNLLLRQHRIQARTKGGWTKKPPLCASTAAILNQYLHTRTDPLPALFLNKWGQPVTKSWIQRMVKEAGHDAGLPFLTSRILRHTFATFAADRHGTIVTRALLGHRLAMTTAVYTHLSPRKFRPLMNVHPYQNVLHQSTNR